MNSRLETDSNPHKKIKTSPQLRPIYSEVHKFACIYLKIKPNQLSKGALYLKIVQYGIKLSTKHPSETNNNFENSHLKSIIFLYISFTIFQLRLRYFVIKMILILNILHVFSPS